MPKLWKVLFLLHAAAIALYAMTAAAQNATASWKPTRVVPTDTREISTRVETPLENIAQGPKV